MKVDMEMIAENNNLKESESSPDVKMEDIEEKVIPIVPLNQRLMKKSSNVKEDENTLKEEKKSLKIEDNPHKKEDCVKLSVNNDEEKI